MAPHGGPTRMLQKRRALLLQAATLHQIVGVQASHQLTPTRPEAGVQSRHNAAMLYSQYPKPRVARRKLPGNLRGRVGRAVVDDQAFPIALALSLHAAQRRSQRGSGVI